MNDSFTKRVAIAPDVMFRVVGDESVLLHLKSETYLGLDPVGTRMWIVLTQSGSVQEAFDTLLQEYDVDGRQLKSDLEEFLTKLVQNDLVQVDSAEPVASGD